MKPLLAEGSCSESRHPATSSMHSLCASTHAAGNLPGPQNLDTREARPFAMARLICRSVAALLLSISAALGPGIGRGDELDAYVEDQVKRQLLPGLSLAVVKEGKIVVARGYGSANLETSEPATPGCVYELGSMTKQFTAMAVLMLVHERKLSLDDSITRHIPEAPEAWREVTIRHLLNHTSGIPSHTEMAVIHADEGKDYTRENLLGLIAKPAMKFRPGDAGPTTTAAMSCSSGLSRGPRAFPTRLTWPSGSSTSGDGRDAVLLKGRHLPARHGLRPA